MVKRLHYALGRSKAFWMGLGSSRLLAHHEAHAIGVDAYLYLHPVERERGELRNCERG
jgi:hypothetical protein